MPKYSTAFGMDVHLRSTTVCALDADTGEAVTRRFPGNPWGEIAGWMDGFPGPSLAAYESGYLGFAPQRELAGLGIECVVAAVSKIPRSAADSASKNDRNDAARMAKAILAHDISPAWVPSPEVEGIRDLAGTYDGATARLATAKQRLLAFLAKRGFVYGGTTPAGNPRKYWTYDFLRWLDKVRPEDDGGVRTLAALRNEVEAAAEARADLLSEYRAAVDASPIVLASIYFSPVSLNRRTVRAKAVSPVALTYFHRFRSRLDGPVPRQVLQPVGPAGYLDQVAVVAHPVRDRARRHVVPEHPAPAADPHVGGDDRRALLVARRYQLEQQVRARAADVEVAELVDDQQPRVGVVLEPLLEDAARRGVLQVLDEPGAVHEPDLASRPDGLDAQRDGEVRLAHAGAPHEQDVLGMMCREGAE